MIPLVPDPLGWGVDKASQIAENWLIDLATKAGQSAQVFLEKTATFWVTGIQSPQLTYATDQNPYTPASTVGYLWAHLHWYVSALAVLSIFIAAGKMAVQRNGAPARELLQSI
jgi:type IV secretion system protein TrbL